MTKPEIAKSLQTLYATQGASSFFAIEEGEGGKCVVEYQLKRYIREDMSVDKIDDSILSLDQQKTDMIAIKDSLIS